MKNKNKKRLTLKKKLIILIFYYLSLKRLKNALHFRYQTYQAKFQ